MDWNNFTAASRGDQIEMSHLFDSIWFIDVDLALSLNNSNYGIY